MLNTFCCIGPPPQQRITSPECPQCGGRETSVPGKVAVHCPPGGTLSFARLGELHTSAEVGPCGPESLLLQRPEKVPGTGVPAWLSDFCSSESQLTLPGCCMGPPVPSRDPRTWCVLPPPHTEYCNFHFSCFSVQTNQPS